jgi:penicillin-binding protein 1A
MERIHENLENKPFYENVPDGVKTVEVCTVSGLLPCKECAETTKEYFPSNAVPKEECNMHQKLTVCGLSGKLLSPFCPEIYQLTRSVVIIPKDSIYQQLDDEQLQELIPGAFRSLEELDLIDYSNPEHKDLFCPLHNDIWYTGEEQRIVLTKQANQLIAQIQDNMNQYSAYLTQAQKDALNNAINSLKEVLIEETLELPKEGEPYYTEIASFQPETVITEMDELLKVYESVFNADLWNIINNGGNTGDDDDDNNGNGNDGNNANNGNNRKDHRGPGRN